MLDVAKTLAGVGQNERWFWRSFCGRYSIFGELGRRFERVTSLVCEAVVIFDFGHYDESIGAALWMLRVHYFADLDKKWLRPK